ncbi:MAG TPA: chromate efflux transporter, partial [Myxococcaceae bacterium]|nr:chromate efflux transporter [Myxococcaceae bacterium]
MPETDRVTEAARPGAHGLKEVALLFLRLGFTAFGGPAAHIAMMEDEVVRRRRWLSREDFLDLLGATHLIPGPNSTELAIHLGHRRGGWAGLLVAGACFILPATLIVSAVAWAYVRFGSLPAAEALLYGIKPVIIAVVLQALWGLGRSAVKTRLLAAVGVAAVGASAVGLDELLVLAGAGVVMVLWRWGERAAGRGGEPGGRGGRMAVGLPLALHGLVAGATSVAPFSLGKLFLFFVKVGSVLFGSGYVLLAFLEGEFVDRFGWLTQAQLVDAIAVGQVTPGPVFTTATFVGYVVAGLPGAFLATVAIFLPSFVFVGLLTRITHRLRSSRWMAAGLDGVNAAALALMAGVTARLAGTAVVDPLPAAITVVTLALLWRTRLNSTWYVAGGAAVGLLQA